MLASVIPLAWFASEFQDRRWLRLALGTSAILLSFGVASVVGSLERFNANAWFGTASKNLIDATITELEAGRQASVLRSLQALQRKYTPTYENRARYDVLIQEALAEMHSGRGSGP